MNCHLTVLMAVYNGAPYLRIAIDSILQQTYRDFHFLIIDDGSTDGTRSILRSYDDKRIEVLCLDRNVGQTAALNIGLRHISAPWIARMDADDYSAPTRLEEQMRALDADKSLSCLGTFAWEFRNDPIVVEAIHTKPIHHADIRRPLLRGSPTIIHGSVVVKRAALLDVGGFDERYRYCGELELYDRLLAKHFAANLPRQLLGIRRHKNAASYSKVAADEYIDFLSHKLSTNHFSRADAAVLRAQLSTAYLCRVRNIRTRRDFHQMLSDLTCAFRGSPRTFLWHSLRFLIPWQMPLPSTWLPKGINGTAQREGAPDMARPTLSSLERLAEALHTVRRNCPVVPVLAIPWMHPKNPIDPVLDELMREEGAGEKQVAARAGLRDWILWKVGRYVLHTARLVLMLFRMRWRLRREIYALKGQLFDIVAKTWCFGPGRSLDDQDFYYGDLQRRLADRGVRMLLLCGDASGADREVFARAQISTSGLCRFPELCLVPLWAPVWMAVKQVVSSLRLWLMKVRERDVLLRRIYELAGRDCLSLSTAFAGLFFWIGRVAVRTWRPRAFVTLYEGHGWEKCAWRGAKMADSSCRTVGYQHTVVHEYNISLLRPHDHQSEHSTPDVVLCLGEKTRRMMQPGHLMRQSQLITFGSFRRNLNGNTQAVPQPAKRTVLVLPEGLLSEAKVLFEHAMKVSPFLPDHHFIFRCHPVLPFDQVRPHLESVPEAFPNIELSSQDLIADDFVRSSVVLYRGSSSVLYAVLHGLKPIYLHNDQFHDVDPLFELTTWRECVSSPDETRQLLRQYAEAGKESVSEQWGRAWEYVRTYTMPVDDASIDRFLTTVALSGGKPLK